MSEVDQGFAPLFAACEARSHAADYTRFRDDRAFHFMVPVGSQRLGPDFEALGRAASFDVDLCARYMKRPKSALGYADPTQYQRWDAIDSRHIMMSTFIFGSRALPAGIRIVEIGGGFGNWVRLNHSVIDFARWTIIDLTFVSKLQRWYLEQEVGPLADLKVALVDSEAYPDWKRSSDAEADLVIGSHSLSELDWATFCEYFDNVVSKAPAFFYATHRSRPSQELVQRKLDRIRERFKEERYFLSENGQVASILFGLK
jgi:hypothetical protein